jgi:hypothetical protein
LFQTFTDELITEESRINDVNEIRRVLDEI